MENVIHPSLPAKPKNNWIAVGIGLLVVFLYASSIAKQRVADASWPYKNPYFLSTELPKVDPSVVPRSANPASRPRTNSGGSAVSPRASDSTSQPRPNNQAKPALIHYAAPDGSFQVLFPPNPTVKAEPLPNQPHITKSSYLGRLQGRYYQINVVYPIPETRKDPYEALVAFQNGILQYLPDYSLQSTSRTTVNDQPALEFTAYNEKTKYYYRWRVFMIGQALYQLGLATNSKDPSGFSEFTSSFTLTPGQ